MVGSGSVAPPPPMRKPLHLGYICMIGQDQVNPKQTHIKVRNQVKHSRVEVIRARCIVKGELINIDDVTAAARAHTHTHAHAYG